MKESAVRSPEEGLEETMTLQRFGFFESLGISLKTTDGIESLNSQTEQYTKRVTYWKNSHQRQRWVGPCLRLNPLSGKCRVIGFYRFYESIWKTLTEKTEKQTQRRSYANFN